jgi:hypothetical protein
VLALSCLSACLLACLSGWLAVCPSVYMEQLASPERIFMKIMLEIFGKSVRKIQVSLKSDKKSGSFM